jgi:hypothetical protein
MKGAVADLVDRGFLEAEEDAQTPGKAFNAQQVISVRGNVDLVPRKTEIAQQVALMGTTV